MSYVLGIDGGGTHVTALLATREGHVVGSGAGGPANVQAVDAASVREALETAIATTLAAAPGGPVAREQVAAAVAGLAGLHVEADEIRCTALLQDLLPASRVGVRNDGEIALYGATCGGEGVVVIAGTGSIAFGADRQGRLMRCGGWGHIAGDEGSAYAIVIQALRAATQAYDGREPDSTLVAALAGALGVTSFDDVVPRLYGPPPLTRHQLAALAPLVARCAAEGDAAALSIFDTAGADLATMAVTTARRLGLGDAPFVVAYSGGAWQAGETLLEPFRRRVLVAYPSATIGRAALTPAAGAALLAIGMIDGDDAATTASVVENLRGSLATSAQLRA